MKESTDVRKKNESGHSLRLDITFATHILVNEYNKIKRFGVRRIGLFGSIIHDKLDEASDIDILVEFEEGKEKFNNFLRLHDFLQRILNRKIDLVTTESLSPYIAPHILKEVKYVEEFDRIS